jgi:hypothetical protein
VDGDVSTYGAADCMVEEAAYRTFVESLRQHDFLSYTVGRSWADGLCDALPTATTWRPYTAS